ncbi:MAG: tRNA (N(6)-L-threonylcarbamoyladenosine(37)-C(2))-methylthiotransferase MtaB [Candidatus Aureabacteria bacterium]|nr:tRNA (N(6)-L-threonylcarbamoyladenosine(37)-C(2))-methylthiotransferase MtaB [Candidatus Auribacterota bacterium]
MKTYIIKTFGCKVNQYDSQEIRSSLERLGYKEQARPDTLSRPFFIIINGCTVTHSSDAKVKACLRKYSREYPGARIVLTGCSAASRYFHADLQGLVKVKKKSLAEYLAAFKCERAGNGSNSKGRARTRAFLKVQEGCGNFCSYCIVPFVRGLPRSRPSKEIIEEAARFADKGFKEIVITGINISAYRDRSVRLADLLDKISNTAGIDRIRISSIEPSEEVNRVVKLFERGKPFCPHFHIPLQSASDRMLKSMNRKYSFAEYTDYINDIRDSLTGSTVSTDIIAGYPGETEDDFGTTLNAVKMLGFIRVHVFPFSPRKGTKAFNLENRVSQETINKRARKIKMEADLSALRLKKALQGKEAEVLVENRKSDVWSGFTENYLRVILNTETKENQANKIVKVKLVSVNDSGIFRASCMPN